MTEQMEGQQALAQEEPVLPGLPPALEQGRQADNTRFTRRRFRKRKLVLWGVAVVLAGAAVYQLFLKPPAVVPAANTPLTKTDLQNEISLTGTVESAQAVMVYSDLNSFVQQVEVRVGDRVEAGQVLAQLDTADLELQIAQQQAELNKISQQSTLSQQMRQRELENAQGDLENGLDASLISAENSLRSAQQELNDARRDLEEHRDDLDHADEVMNAAEKALSRASAARDKAERAWKAADPSDPNYEQLKKAYDDAEAAWEAAFQDWQEKDTEYGGDLSSYSRNYRSARVAYENALAAYNAAQNASGQNLENLEDQLRSAQIDGDTTANQIALQQSQKDLADSTIKAPISGTVTAVYAKVGAPGSGLLFVVENTDDLVIKTELKEYDVASVQEGMPVQVKSDATGDRVFPASVSHIAPTAQKAADGSTQSSGSVEFDTEVRLDQPDSGLRVGMNVRMTVVTAERKGVWAVPYDALVTDAQGQTAVYVARPQGEEGGMVAVEVPVDTGLETDFYVEISSGQLAEGDLLLTQPAGILPGAPVTLAPAEGSGL